MLGWIIRISICAIIFTFVSYFLPKSNIKNVAIVSMSFLFLTIIMHPLKDFATELFTNKIAIEAEMHQMINQAQGDSAEHQVMEYYKEKIAQQTIEALKVKNYNCNNMIITVDENIDSSSFGMVLNVVCSVAPVAEKENSVGAVRVPEIVIDKSGISITEKEPENGDKNINEVEVKEIISQATGAEYDRIIIRWGD